MGDQTSDSSQRGQRESNRPPIGVLSHQTKYNSFLSPLRYDAIMDYRQLGNTGVFVSRICFGAMTFGGSGSIYQVIGGLPQWDADQLVGGCLYAGGHFFDTANVYALGESATM